MAQPKKPNARQRRLAAQARPKARAQRTPQEIAAARAVRAWERYQNRRTVAQGGTAPTWQDFLQPLDTAALEAMAASLAQGDIQPAQQAIALQQQQAGRQSEQQQGLIRNLTGELGGMVAPIGGQIQQTFRSAADDQASFAKGFSDGMRLLAERDAQQNTDDLTRLAGAPASQIGQVQQASQGGTDALYGLGGYNPATSLGQQGANWAAYGNVLPAVVARQGQQDAGAIANAYRDTTTDLGQRSADLAAQLPSLTATRRQTLLDRELQKLEMRRNITDSNRSYQLQVQAAKEAIRQFGIQAGQSQQEIDQRIREFEANFGLETQKYLDSLPGGPLYDPPGGTGGKTGPTQAQRETAIGKFVSAVGDVQKTGTQLGLLTTSTSGGNIFGSGDKQTTYKPSLSWTQAMSKLRKAYSAQIAGLRKLGVAPGRITNLLQGLLVQMGYTQPRGVSFNPNTWGNPWTTTIPSSSVGGSGPGPGV